MIDQIIPRYFTTNEDERLVGEGAMIQAQNVSFVEDGEGTMLVMKNAKGTIAATAASDSDQITDGREVRVIGSVADDQRSKIYFFVCGIDNADDHAIYQYDTLNNTYKVVLRNDWLNFSKDSFVKADIVNRNFQQDDVLQSVIYFTDNVNPPRKINVDRALSDDYDFGIDNSFDHALGVIKAPLIFAPTATFKTDVNLKVNNFLRTTFQFATQVVYKDGEESAISPYSKISIPNNIGLEGLDDQEELSGADLLTDNVLEIVVPYTSSESNDDAYRPEVILVRLYARNGNNGPWLSIDEFDPNDNLYRRVYGSNKKVFDKNTKVYTFYNEGVYGGVPDVLVNKTYDNVPLLAEGQAFVGNRLLYSNYKEGRENLSVPSGETHQLSVKYSDVTDGTVSISDTESTTIITKANDGTGNIEIDLAASSEYSLVGDSVDDGTIVQLELTFRPYQFQVAGEDDSPDMFWAQCSLASQNQGFQGAIGITVKNDSAAGDMVFTQVGSDEAAINREFIVPAASTVDDVLDLIVEEINEVGSFTDTYFADYGDGSQQLTGIVKYIRPGASTDLVVDTTNDLVLSSCRFDVRWEWNAVKDGTKVVIKPYPSKISWKQANGGGDVRINSPVQTFYNYTQLPTDLKNFIEDMEEATGDELEDNISWRNSNQADVPDYTSVDGVSGYLTDELIQFSTRGTKNTFKAGSSHRLGVVYYDKYGRHGFVNEIGQVYVKTFQERNGTSEKFGTAAVVLNWEYAMPDWADKWSLVYGGNTSFSDSFQYTVGSAWVPAKGESNGIDNNNKRVYVSLDTLEKFKSVKKPTLEYSFTKGDRLRVISHKNNSNTDIVYPQPTGYGSSAEDRYIEFNVVDFVTLGNTENPLYTPSNGNTVPDVYKGKFLVLDAPDVNGGAVDGSLGVSVKFGGFDWFSLAKSRFGGDVDYPDGTNAISSNKWHQECLVEIVTPRVAENTVFYEIGYEGSKTTPKGGLTNHGPNVTIDGAEYFMRTRSCATKDYSLNNSWQFAGNNDPEDYRFKNKLVETKDASDFFNSGSWSKGKPHVKFDRAASVRRYNGITYSDAYEEDVSNLSLSSFNASLANFASLDSRFGAARYIVNYDENLLCLQENKVSRASVNKDILQTASSQNLVSLSTKVVGPPTYYQGDYGVGDHPESVLMYDGDVFFCDVSRRKVLRFNPGAGGVLPISDTDISSMIDDEFQALETSTGTKKVVSGYDPRAGVYYVTLDNRDDDSYNGKTVSYDLRMRKWRGTYTFIPDFYANQNRLMYSCRYVNAATDSIFHRHEDTDQVDNRNKFYEGDTAESIVEVISKVNPHMVKVFNALSIEGTEAWDVQIVSSNNQDTGSGNMPASTFEDKEGQFYRSIPGDSTSSSTSHYHHVGRIKSVSGSTITFEKPISRVPVPLGVNTRFVDSGSFSTPGGSDANSVINSKTSDTITIQGTASGSLVGKDLFYITDQSSDGDKVRGHYAKIKLTNTSSDLIEIFSVNTHYTNSRLNHALGQ